MEVENATVNVIPSESVNRLTGEFNSLNKVLGTLNRRMIKVSKVHTNLNQINGSLGSLLGAMAVRSSCLEHEPKVFAEQKVVSNDNNNTDRHHHHHHHPSPVKKTLASPPTPTPVPSVISKIPEPKKVVASNNKSKPKVMEKPKLWRWKKGVRPRLPKVYKNPEGLERLEMILLYISNTSSGATLSELVKYTNLPVIKCKEMLQTLVRVGQLSQSKEKQKGFVYKCI